VVLVADADGHARERSLMERVLRRRDEDWYSDCRVSETAGRADALSRGARSEPRRTKVLRAWLIAMAIGSTTSSTMQVVRTAMAIVMAV